MCGIVGVVHQVSKTQIEAMTGLLTHRGPDGSGHYFDSEERVALGHRRLAIIDAEGGAQPMWNSDCSVGVVFNGEIYNHLALRKELVAKGYRFSSDHSDTEVLIYGWMAWKEALPSRLNGMFAFAIYDRAEKRIFCARDRFGEKPLYYSASPKVFAFASEISPLFLHDHIDDALDTDIALQKYFAYGFVPSPNTIFASVKKLPAGSWLDYRMTSRRLVVSPYWEFRLNPAPEYSTRALSEVADEFWELFLNSVRSRLMSDVPLGVFLSGGLDSSAALAAVKEMYPKQPVSTFTVGFNESSFDETPFAEVVAKQFGTEHRTEILDIATAKDLVSTVLRQVDDPSADPSILPTYLLSNFTKRHVSVALSGDGGDELLAGYDPFLAVRYALLYKKMVPKKLHQLLSHLVEFMPSSTKNMSLDFKLKRTLGGLSYAEQYWNPVWLSPLSPLGIKELFTRPLPKEELYSEAITEWEQLSDLSEIERSLSFYTKFYLTENILAKVDRASMLNSLETRSVFLDNDLTNFFCRLPLSFKLHGTNRKYLLKRALAEKLDEQIINRKKKGFGIPASKWLREFPKPRVAPESLGMKSGVSKDVWERHRTGKEDHRLFLWALFSLDQSLDKYAA